MTPEEFTAKMKQCFNSFDIEKNHGDADDLMCETLESLGYAEGVAVFRTQEKWYA